MFRFSLSNLASAFWKASEPTPFKVKGFLSSLKPEEPSEFLMALELSGNGFTFEIRERANYTKKFEEIDRIKIKLPNSADIRRTGKISEESIEAMMKQLRIIKAVVNNQIRKGHTVYLKAVGTAALRDAENGPDIEKRFYDLTGIEFEKIDGHQEAVFCALGLTQFYPRMSGLVIDMGGGSTEAALVKDGEILRTGSLAFGTSAADMVDEPKQFVRSLLETLQPSFFDVDTVFLSGGTFRNINNALATRMGENIKGDFPPITSFDDYIDFIKELRDMGDEAWEAMPENIQKRREFMDAALIVAKAIKNKMPDNIKIALTKTKTRDGIYRTMDEKISEHEREMAQKLQNSGPFYRGLSRIFSR